MLKISRHVNHLLQMILTHTIAIVGDIYASGFSHKRLANDMKASREGEKGRSDVVQSSLVCLFAVIFCSMSPVNMPIISAINTAALHKAVNVLLLKC